MFYWETWYGKCSTTLRMLDSRMIFLNSVKSMKEGRESTNFTQVCLKGGKNKALKKSITCPIALLIKKNISL